MNYKLKIMVACPNGAGSSLLMKFNIAKVLQKLNIDYDVIDHYSLAEGMDKFRDYQVIFCPLRFKDVFRQASKEGVEVIALTNVLSETEAIEKINHLINKRD